MKDNTEEESLLERMSLSILTHDDKLQKGELQNDDFTAVKDEQVFVIPEGRKLGFTSVVFLIVNSMIGTGIFSTPASVYRAVNNVGSAFMLWVTGGVLTISRQNPLLLS